VHNTQLHIELYFISTWKLLKVPWL